MALQKLRHEALGFIIRPYERQREEGERRYGEWRGGKAGSKEGRGKGEKEGGWRERAGSILF